MLSCKAISEMLSESFEHELSWWMRVKLRFHWMICGPCSFYCKQVRAMKTILKGYDAAVEKFELESCDPMPEDVRKEIKDFLAKELKD